MGYEKTLVLMAPITFFMNLSTKSSAARVGLNPICGIPVPNCIPSEISLYNPCIST
jgi:hypothetical protein